MGNIQFTVTGRVYPVRDTAMILESEDPHEELVRAIIQCISTDIEIEAGGVTLFLAAWQDPQHWSQEWAEALKVDVDEAPEAAEEFIAGLVYTRKDN